MCSGVTVRKARLAPIAQSKDTTTGEATLDIPHPTYLTQPTPLSLSLSMLDEVCHLRSAPRYPYVYLQDGVNVLGPTLSTSIACQSLPIPIREGHSLPLHGTAVADPASEIHHLLSSVLCLFQWAMVYHHLSLMAMLLYHYLCLMRWVTG
jgi:hypothetical protein